MYTTLISLGLASAIFFLCFKFFGLIGSILPALAMLIISFIFISRKTAKKLEGVMKQVQDDLLKNNIDNAISNLKYIKNQYARWQFFLGSTIDGQIGVIYFMKNLSLKAKPFLERAFIRHWVAKAMLAVLYYRERNFSKMDETFESATRYTKKTGLLWSTWAYCAWRIGDIEKAINILAKGKSYLGDNDQVLSSNLLLLQNQKKMKMRGYGEQWYQFQLELSPQQTQMRQGRVRFRAR